jgi:dihydroxyacetone kinase-like predicted kinase
MAPIPGRLQGVFPDRGPGERLLAAAQRAAAHLAAHVDEVDGLNVFPVPDGDTGTNLLATIRSAIEGALAVPPAERSLGRVGAALSLGALMGARGNSGVILSQILRGMGEQVDGQSSIDGRDLARALQGGSDAAYAAIAKPVEGTMLTVIRETAAAAAV